MKCTSTYYHLKVFSTRFITSCTQNENLFFDLFAGLLASIALIIFGALGDNRDFMPDWENNYLSWSFGLGFVGAVADFVAGVLFIVEARIMTRKEIARERQFPMEQRV